MTKLSAKVVAIVLAFVAVLSVGGVLATWVYASGDVDPVATLFPVSVGVWTEGDNQGDMTGDESNLTNRFISVLNGETSQNLSQEQINAVSQAIANRKNEGGFFAPVNELLADDKDAEALREALGLDANSEMTVIIKFVDNNPDCDYELFTTRVDLDKKDSNGQYVIPESAFADENYYIYPVNRTTFVKKDGKLVADTVSVGYSRAIYYWENGQKTTTRTYDVTLWNKGTSVSDAVYVTKASDFYIYYDIGHIGADDLTAAYFMRVNETQGWGGYTYNETAFANSVAMADSKNYTCTRIRGNSTNNACLKINFNSSGTNITPSPSQPNIVHVTI